MYKKYFKRLFDFILSLTALIILAPLFLFLIIVVWVSMGRPILFVQERPGFQTKIFKLLKFKTMTEEKDANGKLLPDGLRLTKTGKLIRKFSLDELPQLINVLKGDMSLIGPRPLLIEYLPLYNEEQRNRHNIKPGITGWAQVNGRNELSWDKKFQLDVWYAEKYSFYIDAKIFFKTIIKIIKREGISSMSSATMEKFSGRI